MKKLLLLLAFAVFVSFVISGCIGNGNPPGNSSSGSLTLNISGSGVKANAIEPDLDMTIAAYDIIGAGPNRANFRKDNVTPGGAVIINTLAVGSWTIEVNAKNADGILIAYGVTTVTLTAGITVNTSVTVRPIDGTGTLNITVSWPVGIITNPSVTGTLIPVGGTAQNISYTLAGDNLSATYQNNTIATGYYTLITQLKDGSTLKWSAVDVVRIINGQTSTGTYVLNAIQGQFGDIELVINPDLQNPITVTFSGQQNILMVGTDMTVTATPSQSIDSYQWYLNGAPLPGATNASLTIGKSLGMGSYRLDVVVKKGNILGAGSILFNIRINQIVFSSTRDGNWEIYSMNPDGSNQTRLTNNSTADYEPFRSPDGCKIAFTSTRNGNSEIYIMNLDGSNQTRITNTSFENCMPAWSPDGGKIAFSSKRTGNYEIYVMNIDGSNQTQITTSPYNSHRPAWSPDGKKIAFDSGTLEHPDVYVINADGSNRVRLTSHGNDLSPCWSPDGTKIAFMAYDLPCFNIFTINPDGSGRTVIAFSQDGSNDHPRWSPDGKKIVFVSDKYYPPGGGSPTDIYVINSDGSNRIRLTSGGSYNNYASW